MYHSGRRLRRTSRLLFPAGACDAPHSSASPLNTLETETVSNTPQTGMQTCELQLQVDQIKIHAFHFWQQGLKEGKRGKNLLIRNRGEDKSLYHLLEALSVDDGRSRLVVLAAHVSCVQARALLTYDLAIHICWKVDSEARIEPPIQTEYSAGQSGTAR